MNFEITNNKIANQTVQTIDGLDLHKELQIGKDYSNWMKAQIKRAGLIENEDYCLLAQKGEQKGSGGANKIDYFLTLDSAKHIAMMSQSAKGREIRNYFIKIEKSYLKQQKQQFQIEWQAARLAGKQQRKDLAAAISRLEQLANEQGGVKLDRNGNPTTRNYHATVTKMIYKQLFGDGSLKNFRDQLDHIKLQFLDICEAACSEEIERLAELEIDYHDIYSECKKRVIVVTESLAKTGMVGKSDNLIKLSWQEKK